jgi:hypothetical protein
VSSEQDAFARVVGALRPYLSELVVVGGWAHRLFRLHPQATPPPFHPLVTDDADVATPLELEANRPPIDGLLKAAGFTEDLRGDESPPVSRYTLETPDQALELEFIANLQGSLHRRDGSRNVTVLVAGITAQKVRHVDALLLDPWTVRLDEGVGYRIPDGPADVLIPNAAAYLFQKLITLSSRQVDKRGKDVLYVFDTLLLFSSSLPELRRHWERLSPRLTEPVRRDFARLWRSRFIAGADEVVAAASIARNTGRSSPPSAATIAATCRAGFQEVFAAP